MDIEKRERGRPKKSPKKLKKGRGISMTDSEYQKLVELADAEEMGVSEYIITKLNLNRKD